MTPPDDLPRPEFEDNDPKPKAKELILTSMADGSTPTCPNCGKHSFSWGFVRGRSPLKFVDENAGFLQKSTVFGGQPVRARKCNSCRNIQLFAGR